MNRERQHRRHVTAALGLLGGSLGVIAGLIQATVGTQIPEWTGNKASPVALGLLTVHLSALALLCANAVRSAPRLSPERRVVIAIGLLVPGGLCFTTVGALWYLPGALLLLGAVSVIAAGDMRQTREVVATNWLRAMVSALGALELLMAVSSDAVVTIAVGVVGGLALVVAPWASTVRWGAVLLLTGTLPFAILTWWSLASPLLAVLAIAIGVTALRPPLRMSRIS